MIIAQSQITFGYKHSYSETVSVKESLATRPTANTDSVPSGNTTSDELSQNTLDAPADSETQHLDVKTAQLKMLVEQLAGHKITLTSPSNLDSATGTQNDNQGNAQARQSTTADLIYQYEESYLEHESGHFSASGQLLTSTGDTINIALSHCSERQYYIQNRFEMTVGEVELTDPLVLNLGHSTHSGLDLTHNKVAFDIDADGKTDKVHFATGTSGFLAIDINMNGIIDDGSELFGARTGNGFNELAKYDSDGNHFIDAGDPVFSNLAFYQRDNSGSDVITPLSALGIGALYLGNIAAPFEVKDANNQLQAVVRANSFFLYEDGRTGTFQQIDLAV
ncbi:hypothetical protein LHL20_02120 [Alteromonas sp. McT4-15]|uniref:hypothetical protein n=1 Tax=Alteromonas sp. McT4-15 TaxID=2881256 RepID=UPI001CF8F612|nr:hypothetical protein [Alteromonas sp. McT4-15]MCB4435035.1 hypothetical protein [Alteromonas sp. McT4-15]